MNFRKLWEKQQQQQLESIYANPHNPTTPDILRGFVKDRGQPLTRKINILLPGLKESI